MIRLLVLLALAGCPAPPPKFVEPPTALEMIQASTDLEGFAIERGPERATIVVLLASWCEHCRAQLEQLAQIRSAHPAARIVGVSYKGHEEYDNRGNAHALRAYVTENVPWLRVVAADERLFDALGKPPFVPAVWVYARDGKLVASYDRRKREPPTREEIEAVLARLGV